MRWRDRPILAFDTETTGLDPVDGHRVIEFAGVEFRLSPEGSVSEVVRHEWMFNPGRPIPRESSDVHGIRDEDVADKPAFATAARQIHALLQRSVTVAHNYPFDQRMLTYEFQLAGLGWPCPPAEIDTSDLSRRFFKEAREHKLATLAQRLEVPLVQAHRAGDDAEACGRCFLALAARNAAPDDEAAMIDWADAVGEPPSGGHLRRDDAGTIVLGPDTPSPGEPVAAHPDVLHWMTLARARADGRWDWRFPEPTRTWAARWLRIRGSGRFPGGGKGFGAGDWGIDPPAGTLP